jgi:hypothetical protein
MDPMEGTRFRFDSPLESSALGTLMRSAASGLAPGRRSRQSTGRRAGRRVWNESGMEDSIPMEGFRFRGRKMLLPLEEASVTRLQEDSKALTMIPKPTEAYKPVGRPPEAYSRRGRVYGAYMEEDPRIQAFERFQAMPSFIPLARLV